MTQTLISLVQKDELGDPWLSNMFTVGAASAIGKRVSVLKLRFKLPDYLDVLLTGKGIETETEGHQSYILSNCWPSEIPHLSSQCEDFPWIIKMDINFV